MNRVVAWALAAQQFRSKALVDALEPSDPDEYASPQSKEALESLRDGAKRLDARLRALGEDLERVEPAQALRSIARFTPLITLVLAEAGSIRLSTQRGGLPHWDRALQRVTPDATERIVLHPVHELNYTTIGFDTRLAPLWRILADEEDAPATLEVQPAPYLLGFPRLLMDHPLQHTMLFHEIGHIWLERSRALRIAVASHLVPDDELAKLFPSGEPDALEYNATLSEWLEELACDLLGFALAGPAFTLAAIDMFTTMSLTYVSTHPPPGLRLEILVNLTLSHGRPSVAIEEYLGEWLTLLNAGYGLGDADTRIPRLRNAVDSLLAAVQSEIGELAWKHDTDIEPLKARITDVGVPPDAWEWGAGALPATLAEALNAGWEAAAQSKLATASAETSSIQRLTGKAVELAEIRRRWSEVS